MVAQYVTAPKPWTAAVVASVADNSNSQDWRTALDAIQAQAPSLPQAPSQDNTQAFLDAAKSSNVTDTVARSLLVNLSSANAQGLGSDIPTQDNLIQTAVSQLPAATPTKTYRTANLTVVADTKQAEHTYGNAVMVAFGKHPGAISQNVLGIVSQALNDNDAQELDGLVGVRAEYQALADNLAAIPVPQTLVPLHLQALNALSTITVTLNDARYVVSDPLRGLQGLQQYQLQLGATADVFTSVAQNFNKNGILFTKDEPGTAWAAFIAPTQ